MKHVYALTMKNPPQYMQLMGIFSKRKDAETWKRIQQRSYKCNYEITKWEVSTEPIEDDA